MVPVTPEYSSMALVWWQVGVQVCAQLGWRPLLVMLVILNFHLMLNWVEILNSRLGLAQTTPSMQTCFWGRGRFHDQTLFTFFTGNCKQRHSFQERAESYQQLPLFTTRDVYRMKWRCRFFEETCPWPSKTWT